MTKRAALIVIFVSMLIIGIGYASAFLPGGAPEAATYAFAVATAAVMTAILVLGAARSGRTLGTLRFVFALTFIVLAVGFSSALSAAEVAADNLYGGLPRGAAVILYVVGLLPMAMLPIAYAMTFEKTTFDEAELEDIRRRLEELKQ